MTEQMQGVDAAIGTGTIRILYIEDDPGLARLLQKILQRRGFTVDIAMNGEDGLAMIDATPYDLLLVDYNMPFLCGIDVIRALTEKGVLPPTIMVTGEGNEAVAVEALKLGALDYIVKDVDMKYLDLLPSVVDQVLYRQQLVKERQQMLKTIRENEERYRLFFESNPIPVMVCDLQTLRFIDVNHAAVAHYGYSRGEFLSMTVHDLFDDGEVPALLEQAGRPGQGGKLAGVWKHRLKNGRIIEAEIASHPIMLGERSSLVMLAHDVSERKQREENIMRSQKLESIGVLAGGLAHDFNNFLTAIIGNISLAKLDADPAVDLYARLKAAEKAASRAQHITQQLLTFSRGGAPLKKPLSVKGLVEDAFALALHGTKSRPEFSLAEDLWGIEGDEGQLGQAFHSLIMNADQAMPEGGIISVTGENTIFGRGNSLGVGEGKYIKITVADRGSGIPQEHLPKIFDPYFTTKQKGSGLGLATCYSIIKRHDGHIAVESSLGEGTAFAVYLPATGENGGDAEMSDAVLQQSLSGRVLVMDDEDMVRDVASRILSALGIVVSCASDGAEAVAMYAEAMKQGRRFDAVIMDLTVPGGVGGKEAVKKLIEIDPAVKAIVSSGYSSDPIMSEYRAYGFQGVVSKPYSVRVLGETVKNVLTGI